MTTQQLLGIDVALTVALVGAWLAAAGVAAGLLFKPSRGSARTTLALVGAGALLTVARIVVVALLATRGWWFVQDKILLALPLLVVPAAIALGISVPALRLALGGRATTDAMTVLVLMVTGFAAALGVVVTFVVGYPVSVTEVLVCISTLAGLSWLTWMGLSKRRDRGRVATSVIIIVVPLVLGLGTAWYSDSTAAGEGHHHPDASGRSVLDLRTPKDAAGPVVSFTLTARNERLTLPSGTKVSAWSFGRLPGPELRVHQGDLVQVRLKNQDITGGVTLHWHGVAVPNGDDGVAGVTQDAVPPGHSFVYRFRATQTGTYWYHTHQLSSVGIARGLYGTFVVLPPASETTADGLDLSLPVHTISGSTLLGGSDINQGRKVAAGTPVRLRLINTDSVPHRLSVAGTAFQVVSVDGADLNRPTALRGAVLRIPAGGRYDVAFLMPARPVGLAVEGAPKTGLTLGSKAAISVPFVDGPDLDLLGYGTPTAVPGITGARFDRRATMVLDRQLRFLDSAPAYAYTINGAVYPNIPPITVAEGDLLLLTIVNRGFETHPMHPHGHRVLVLSRNGVAATGSPLWLDTFDVRPGEVWRVALRADNPGIWMAHCHNLVHATVGMVMHLRYEGVSSPFQMDGPNGNQAE